MPSVVVCIPARNEEKTIATVIVKAKRHADRVIVCDDRSSDMTSQIAEALGAEVMGNKSSSGYGAALGLLFKRAAQLEPDVMVTLDADGQHDPDMIPDLVKPILDGEADIVIGSRFLAKTPDKSMRTYRKMGIKAITKLSDAASGHGLTDGQSGFRAYGREAFGQLAPVELGMGASAEILMRATERELRLVEVPIAVKYRGLDSSTHNPLYHGLDVLGSVLKLLSLRHPLLSYGTLGVATIIFGLAYGYFTIQTYAVQAKPITNIALLSMAIISSGILLVFMAIILFTITSLIKEKIS